MNKVPWCSYLNSKENTEFKLAPAFGKKLMLLPPYIFPFLFYIFTLSSICYYFKTTLESHLNLISFNSSYQMVRDTLG